MVGDLWEAEAGVLSHADGSEFSLGPPAPLLAHVLTSKLPLSDGAAQCQVLQVQEPASCGAERVSGSHGCLGTWGPPGLAFLSSPSTLLPHSSFCRVLLFLPKPSFRGCGQAGHTLGSPSYCWTQTFLGKTRLRDTSSACKGRYDQGLKGRHLLWS